MHIIKYQVCIKTVIGLDGFLRKAPHLGVDSERGLYPRAPLSPSCRWQFTGCSVVGATGPAGNSSSIV